MQRDLCESVIRCQTLGTKKIRLPAMCLNQLKMKQTNLAVVVLLSFVRQHRANDNTRIFNNHFPCFNVSLAKKTTAVNGGPVKDSETENRSLEQLLFHS